MVTHGNLQKVGEKVLYKIGKAQVIPLIHTVTACHQAGSIYACHFSGIKNQGNIYNTMSFNRCSITPGRNYVHKRQKIIIIKSFCTPITPHQETLIKHEVFSHRSQRPVSAYYLFFLMNV